MGEPTAVPSANGFRAGARNLSGRAALVHKNYHPEIPRLMTRKIFLRLTLAVIALGAVAILSTGFGRSSSQRPAPRPAPSVTVAPVEHREIVDWAEFTART